VGEINVINVNTRLETERRTRKGVTIAIRHLEICNLRRINQTPNPKRFAVPQTLTPAYINFPTASLLATLSLERNGLFIVYKLEVSLPNRPFRGVGKLKN
jgi:hypothetical protein